MEASGDVGTRESIEEQESSEIVQTAVPQFSVRMLWDTVSNASLESREITSTTLHHPSILFYLHIDRAGLAAARVQHTMLGHIYTQIFWFFKENLSNNQDLDSPLFW